MTPKSKTHEAAVVHQIGPSNRAIDQKKAWMIVPFPQRLATQPSFPGQAEKNIQERFQDGLQEKAKNINKTSLYPYFHIRLIV